MSEVESVSTQAGAGGEAAAGGSQPVVPRPEVTPPGEWAFPEPRELDLPNGIRALVHHVPGQYVVSVRVTVPVALRHEPREVEGVAWIMERLLDEDIALDARDPRQVATFDAIERDLKKGSHLFRYVEPDDFGEPETAFNFCTFWFIEALHQNGRVEEAREIFEEMGLDWVR